MSLPLRARLSAVLLLLAVGCGGSTNTPEPGTCVNSSDCPDGFLCFQETCKPIECATSAECAMEQYCDATFRCADGCAEDADCSPGSECNLQDNTCVEYGCRDTQLDCHYGELCDATSGECIADTRAHCESCDITVPNNTCGAGAECVPFAGGSCQTNADCDPGYSCDAFVGGRLCHQDFCLVTCSPQASEEQCPRGLECGDIYGDGSLNACYGDCEWLLANGL